MWTDGTVHYWNHSSCFTGPAEQGGPNAAGIDAVRTQHPTRIEGSTMGLEINMTRSGTIVIRLSKKYLKHAALLLPDFEQYDEASGENLIPKITDAEAFAKCVFDALVDEEEDGTTPVHRMFEDAIREAVEQGAEGIVFPNEREYGRKVFAR
ncbi:MAG TPA: hypothetical protein VGX71_06180 [Pseudaminobacter sp.]|nr:hypothetical protein [Pseudaminobacter sp.]